MSHKKTNILIVDDDPGIQEIMRIVLERQGYRVHIAEDGEKAISRFLDVGPDLVISDISMPKGDGFNVAILIRSKEGKEKKTPILLVSAFYDDQGNRDNAERCGADAFLSKPFTQRQLLDAVEGLLDG
ncbi:transcriptional regulatory protein YycF [bacterium BMS3Abin14]|nr:transcriptional regulatory protein YycF [bacterium BMS3Abin14]